MPVQPPGRKPSAASASGDRDQTAATLVKASTADLPTWDGLDLCHTMCLHRQRKSGIICRRLLRWDADDMEGESECLGLSSNVAVVFAALSFSNFNVAAVLFRWLYLFLLSSQY